MSSRTCVIYARLSVTTEQSVSIARQLEAGERYAAAQGWRVVGTFVDDGVSATKNRPEQRPAWRALLDSREPFDSVIIWKLDRLARRITDFWDAVKALDEAGRSLVSITDSLDLRTTIGQIVAGVIAGFAQMEAEAISARVADSRQKLIRDGRVPGGTIPYGWRTVRNPDGAGYVLAQDPDRIGYVREMAERVRRGDSIYSIIQWLDEAKAPLPTTGKAKRRAAAEAEETEEQQAERLAEEEADPTKRRRVRKHDGWTYSTVERILRNPVLAGMTALNPGNDSRVRGREVLRGPDGLPAVRGSGILSVASWRAMVAALDARDSAQSAPRAMRSSTSPLLSGLLLCGEHLPEVRMHRGTTAGRAGYSCPVCYQTISNFEPAVIEEFLRQKGPRVHWTQVEEVYEGGEALIPEIEVRLAELGAKLALADDDDRAALTVEIDGLRAMRQEARGRPARVVEALTPVGWFEEDWLLADSPEDRRAILGDAIERIWVVRGRPGRRTTAGLLARLVFEWIVPEDLGPIVAPDDKTLGAWAG